MWLYAGACEAVNLVGVSAQDVANRNSKLTQTLDFIQRDKDCDVRALAADPAS
jgi:hypothetical protein